MNLKDLDRLIEDVSSTRRSATITDTLMQMVENVLDNYYDNLPILQESKQVVEEQFERGREFLLTLPKFAPNENWGKPGSADRESIDRIFNAIGGGATLDEKLKFLQKIGDPKVKITSPRRIISSLIILESLSTIITSFQASPAGFIFEAFLAALLRGHQIPAAGADTIADLEGFSQLKGGDKKVSISLKLLSPNTVIEGSYTDLIDSLNNSDTMTYVIARKDGGELKIESFVFTRENFLEAISKSARGSGLKKSGAELFRLPGKTPEASLQYINSLPSWEEKYEALQQTAAYRGLNESRTQWNINGKQLDRLAQENLVEYSYLGELPFAPERIYQIAEDRMKVLDTSLMALFASTKSLSDNVNLYISEKKRNSAIRAGRSAVADTTKIAESLKGSLEKDEKDKNLS